MSRIIECFQTAQKDDGSATVGRCSAQIGLLVANYICATLFLVMLFLEVKRQTSFKSIIRNVRTWIFFVAALNLINSGNHYLFYPSSFITVSLIMLESSRFFIFFMVCFFFCKKAAYLLPDNSSWIHGLHVFLILNIVWTVGCVSVTNIGYVMEFEDYSYLCHTILFMTLRFSGETTTLIFTIIGILITFKVVRPKSIKSLKYSTYDLKQQKHQHQAIKKLWIVISCFIFVSIEICVYDIISFNSASCRVVSGVQWFSDAIWILSRYCAYEIWSIPILYVFWPKFQTSGKNKKKAKDSIKPSDMRSSDNVNQFNMYETYSEQLEEHFRGNLDTERKSMDSQKFTLLVADKSEIKNHFFFQIRKSKNQRSTVGGLERINSSALNAGGSGRINSIAVNAGGAGRMDSINDSFYLNTTNSIN